MKSRILISAFLMVFLAGCEGKAQVEELTRQNEALRTEMDQMRVIAAKGQRLDELAKFFLGFRARIVTTAGTIELRFYPELAPIHVLAFVSRAESGFYNDSYFHRVIPGFMIQGGDPNTRNEDPLDDGMGGPMGAIPHEFNPTPHKRGILSMARMGDKSLGAGSQFFIMHADYPSLDNEYTVFGEVVTGMEVVDQIATAPINNSDPRFQNRPLNPVKIVSIEIFKAAN